MPAAAATLDACGQTLSGALTLSADLDCPDTFGVWIQGGGTLDLAGFTLTAQLGVTCRGEIAPCLVVSSVPGDMIVGVGGKSGAHGIDAWSSLRVEHVTVSGFGGHGVNSHGRVTIEGSVVTNNQTRGVFAGGDIRISNSTVSDNGGPGLDTNAMQKIAVSDPTISGSGTNGIEGAGIITLDGAIVTGNAGDGIAPEGMPGSPAKVNAKDSTIAANGGDGVDFLAADPLQVQGRLSAANSTFDGNVGDGVRGAGRTRLKGGGAAGNGSAGVRTSSVDGCRVSLVVADVTGNGEYGAFLGDAEAPCPNGRFKAQRSTLVGNDVSSDCGVTIACADIAAATLPNVVGDSTCEHSYVAGSGLPGSSWGVCGLD